MRHENRAPGTRIATTGAGPVTTAAAVPAVCGRQPQVARIQDDTCAVLRIPVPRRAILHAFRGIRAGAHNQCLSRRGSCGAALKKRGFL